MTSCRTWHPWRFLQIINLHKRLSEICNSHGISDLYFLYSTVYILYIHIYSKYVYISYVFYFFLVLQLELAQQVVLAECLDRQVLLGILAVEYLVQGVRVVVLQGSVNLHPPLLLVVWLHPPLEQLHSAQVQVSHYSFGIIAAKNNLILFMPSEIASVVGKDLGRRIRVIYFVL